MKSLYKKYQDMFNNMSITAKFVVVFTAICIMLGAIAVLSIKIGDYKEVRFGSRDAAIHARNDDADAEREAALDAARRSEERAALAEQMINEITSADQYYDYEEETDPSMEELREILSHIND